MGSNTLFRKISSIAVAILLLIYVGYQIYRSQYTGFKTETAMYADLSASIDTTGFIIRNEELVYSRYDGVLNYTLDDGEKTAFGGTVAELYPAEEDAAAHNRMLRIDEELTRLAVLENPTEVASSNPKNIGSQINKTVTGLLSDLKSGAFSSISNDKNDLYLLMGQKQIVTGAEDSASYVAHIENLKSERATLETTTSSSTGTVTSPASGYFIHTVDGYENAVDIDDVEQLTVSDVRALEEGEAGSNADSTVIGKVAKEFNWYIACIIDEKDLVRLYRTTNVKVEMPFATAETIPAEVVKINRDEASGDAVVILKCSYMNTDLAAARKEPLRIDLQSYAGVLVNEKAIHFADVTVTDTDTDGNVTEHVEQNVKGVYIKSGSRVRFVQVFSDATIDGDLYLRKPDFMERDLAPLIQPLAEEERPVVVVVNKVDLFHDKSRMLPLLESVAQMFPKAEIFPASALRRNGVEQLLELIRSHLPEGEAQFPEDQLSTAPMKFMAAEIIREKLFEKLYQEVPYSVAVDVEVWDEEDDRVLIHAAIYVAKPSHKAMVIGRAGEGIKAIGTAARKEIRDLVDKKVHLELWVKVREDWVDDPQFLHSLGFGAEAEY